MKEHVAEDRGRCVKKSANNGKKTQTYLITLEVREILNNSEG
jgi:hypothetical protein